VNQIIVVTVETIRTWALLSLLIPHFKHVMFVGPTGTGKSAYTTVTTMFIPLLTEGYVNKKLKYFKTQYFFI
jgi:type IV secretory pathway ATPase VirB11/archaellum biosynthesis ATPase